VETSVSKCTEIYSIFGKIGIFEIIKVITHFLAIFMNTESIAEKTSHYKFLAVLHIATKCSQ
jgi:hypothetical protein